MSKWDTVAIVGVGLIGGSIGLALRRRKLARHVVGIGRRTVSLRQAKQAGACDLTTTDLAKGVADAELVVVCTPVGQIVAHVRAVVAARPEALVTDAGSTKGEIVTQLAAELPPGARFVGSHPLAGGEKRGPSQANADLLVGRTVVMTPTSATAARDATAVRQFWKALGAQVREMTPAAHDAALAATSHLPHAVAAALAAVTPAETLPLTASGWRDTTRVAAGDAELWRQIFAQNRTDLAAAIGRLTDKLDALRGALVRGDDAAVLALLEEAKARRELADRSPRSKKTSLPTGRKAGG